MRTLLFTYLALSLAACGKSPLHPTPPAPELGPPATLAVLITGNTSHQPKAGVSATLTLPARVALPTGEPLTKVTGADGLVSWTVFTKQPYPITVNGIRHFESVVIVNDSQWLLGVPD